MIDYELLKFVAFLFWAVGTALVLLMGALGGIRTDAFNNVPWSQVLKSPQHQIFIVTLMAFIMMFLLRFMQDCALWR